MARLATTPGTREQFRRSCRQFPTLFACVALELLARVEVSEASSSEVGEPLKRLCCSWVSTSVRVHEPAGRPECGVDHLRRRMSREREGRQPEKIGRAIASKRSMSGSSSTLVGFWLATGSSSVNVVRPPVRIIRCRSSKGIPGSAILRMRTATAACWRCCERVEQQHVCLQCGGVLGQQDLSNNNNNNNTQLETARLGLDTVKGPQINPVLEYELTVNGTWLWLWLWF